MQETTHRLVRLTGRVSQTAKAFVSLPGLPTKLNSAALGLSDKEAEAALRLATLLLAGEDYRRFPLDEGSADPRATDAISTEENDAAIAEAVAPISCRFVSHIARSIDGLAVGVIISFYNEPILADQELRETLNDVADLAARAVERHNRDDTLDNARRRSSYDARLHGSRELLDNIFSAVVVTDLEGSVVNANQLVLERTNLDWDDLMGRKLWELGVWLGQDGVPGQVRAGFSAAARGETVRLSVSTGRSDIDGYHLDLQIAPMRDAEGEISFVVTSAVDVSDRVSAERQHALLAKTIEHATDFIGLATPDGRSIYVNQAGRRLLRTPENETLVGRPVSTFYPVETLPRVFEIGMETAKLKGAWRGDSVLQTADGTKIPVSQTLIAHRDDTGEISHYSTIARDISGRKKVEKRIRDSEQMYRSVFDNAAVGIAKIDANGSWVSANERLLDMLGYTWTELQNRSWIELTDTPFVGGCQQKLERLYGGEVESYQLEKRYYQRSGEPLWVQVTGSLAAPLTGDEPPEAVLIIEDIAERKRAEEHQKVLLAELSHRVKNTLANLQAIANQTNNTTQTKEEFVRTFSGRIQAMAIAHSLLTATDWNGASINELVQQQVALDGDYNRQQISVSGPDVLLTTQAAVHTGLILHELATNARKHGALSVPEGNVSIAWDTDVVEGVPVANLVWTERGGPAAEEQSNGGLGMRLIKAGIPGRQGSSSVEFTQEGLQCTLVLPIPTLTADEQAYFKT